jgi:hypothetical protein
MKTGKWTDAVLGAVVIALACAVSGCRTNPQPVAPSAVWVTPAFGGTTNAIPPWPAIR